MKKSKSVVMWIFYVGFCIFFCTNLFGADLFVSPSDIVLEMDGDTGYHLFIRQKEGVHSVLLTETTRDADGKATNYAYRAMEWNSINGDEKRLLNGAFLESEYAKYSLIDSTPELHPILGSAFHIYIPNQIQYGYPWARSAIITISTGTFINIRTFEKTYADYQGSFSDNPFMFDFNPPPAPEPEEKPILTDNYNPDAALAFNDIASGMMIYSQGPDTLVDDVMKVVRNMEYSEKIDLVFAIDATGSMWDDIEILKRDLVPQIIEEIEKRGNVRLGLLFYRDYGYTAEGFNYGKLPVQYHPFTTNNDDFFAGLNKMKIKQGSIIGGDIPEAVYEALYASIAFYEWDPSAIKKIILIGDAEPHPSPRGVLKCDKTMIEEMSRDKNITIDCIITPDDKGTRGR